MKKKTIELEDLIIGYRQGRRLRKVAGPLRATVRKGELVCLLGENGAGKSTMMRSMCGFQPFFGGTVKIENHSVAELSEKQLSRLVSVVLTDRIDVPNASVREMVSYGRSPYTGITGKIDTEGWKLVDRSVADCGIAHKRDELFSNLSDGERQKVLIAKALAQDTPVILLDEPTAFLDLPARVEIMQLLRRIASSGKRSVLMSTHDLDMALQLSDQLWLLTGDGEIVSGLPEDLLLKHSFQGLFEREGIHFDAVNGTFRVQYPVHHRIFGEGKGLGFQLLQKALARNGIVLSPDRDLSGYQIQETDNGGFCLINRNNQQVICGHEIRGFVDGILQEMGD